MQNTSPTQTVTLVQQAFGLTTQQVAGYANLMIVLHMLSSTYPRVVGSIFFCSSVFLLWSDILGIVASVAGRFRAAEPPPIPVQGNPLSGFSEEELKELDADPELEQLR